MGSLRPFSAHFSNDGSSYSVVPLYGLVDKDREGKPILISSGNFAALWELCPKHGIVVSMKGQSPKYRRASHEAGRPISTYHRGRGAVGAVVGALVPYAMSEAQHGPLLGGSLGVIALFGALMVICGAIAAGFGGSSLLYEKYDIEDEQLWVKKDLYDSLTHQGSYSYRREQ